jgi:hypothetical protein
MSETTLREPLSSKRVSRSSVRSLFSSALGVAFLVVLILGGGWALGLFDPSGIRLRFSEPYALATGLAAEQPLVSEHLGEVRGFGLLPRGDLQITGREGWCEIEVLVKGDKQAANLESRLDRRGGVWFWEYANLRLEDGTLISLPVP